MVRNRIKKTNRGEVAPELMLAAVRKVKKDGFSVRRAAADFQINIGTLRRYCKKIPQQEIDDHSIIRPSTNVGYFPSRKVFSEEEEEELKQWVLQAAESSWSLSPKKVKAFAYKLCSDRSIKCPQSWHDNGCAGEDWFNDFLKRHPVLKRESLVGSSRHGRTKSGSLRMEAENEDATRNFLNIGNSYSDRVQQPCQAPEVATQEFKEAGEPSVLEEPVVSIDTRSMNEDDQSLNSSTSEDQEEEPPSDTRDSSGPTMSSRTSNSRTCPNCSGSRDLESALVKLMNSQIFLEPPDPDKLFLDSLLPFIKHFTEDQKLQFRTDVLEVVKKIKRQNSSAESDENAPHSVNH